MNNNSQNDFIEANTPDSFTLEQDVVQLSNAAAQLIIDINDLESNAFDGSVDLAALQLHHFPSEESLLSKYDHLDGEEQKKEHLAEIISYTQELLDRKKELIEKNKEIEAHFQYIHKNLSRVEKFFYPTIVSTYLNQSRFEPLEVQEKFLKTLRSLIDNENPQASRTKTVKPFINFYDQKTNTHLLEQLAFSFGLRKDRPLTTDADLNILGHRWKFLTKIIELFPPLPEDYAKIVIERKLTTDNEFFKDFYQSSHLEKFLVFFTKISAQINLSNESNHLIKKAVLNFLKTNPSQAISSLDPILQNLTETLADLARIEKRLQEITAHSENQHDEGAQRFFKSLLEKRQAELQVKKNQALLLLKNMDLCFSSQILQPYSCQEQTLNLLAQSLTTHIQDLELVSRTRKTIISIAESAQSFNPAKDANWTSSQIFSLRSLASNLLFEEGPWTSEKEQLLSQINNIAQKSQSIILQNFLTDLVSYQTRTIRLEDKDHRKYLYFAARELAASGTVLDTQRIARLISACCDQDQLLSPNKLIEIYREIKSDIGCRDEDVPEEFLLLLRQFQEKTPITGKDFFNYSQKLTPEERVNLIPALLDQTATKSFDDFYHIYIALSPDEYLEQMTQDSLLKVYPFLKIQQNPETLAKFMASEVISPVLEETHLWLRENAQSSVSEKSIKCYQEMLKSNSLIPEQRRFLNAYLMTTTFMDIHVENPPKTSFDLDTPIYSVIEKLMERKEASREHLMEDAFILRDFIKKTQSKDLQEACALWAQYIEYKADTLNVHQHLKVIFDPNAMVEDCEKAKLELLKGTGGSSYFPPNLSSLQVFCQYLAKTIKSHPERNALLFQSYLQILEDSSLSFDAEKALVLQSTLDMMLKNTKNPIALKAQVLTQIHKISKSNPEILDSLYPLIDSLFKDDKKSSGQLFQMFFKDTSTLRDYQQKISPLFQSLPQEKSVLSFAKREFIAHLMRGVKSEIRADTLLTLIKNVYSDVASGGEYHPEHIATYHNIVRQNIPTKCVSDKIKYIKSFIFDQSINNTMRAQLFDGTSWSAGLVELLVKEQPSDFEKIIELQKIVAALQPKLGVIVSSAIPHGIILELNNILKQKVQEYISQNQENKSAYFLSQKQQECLRINQALGATWESVLELELPDFLRYDSASGRGQILEQSKIGPYLSGLIKSYRPQDNLDIQAQLQSLSLQQFYLICDDIKQVENCPPKLQTIFLDRSHIQKELLIGQISAYAVNNPVFKEKVYSIFENHRQKNLQLLLDETTKLTAEKILSLTQSLGILTSFDKNFEATSLKEIISKRYLSESERLSVHNHVKNIEDEIVQLRALEVSEPYRSFWSGLIIDKIRLLNESEQLSAQICEQYLNNLPSNIEDVLVIRSRMFLSEALHRQILPTEKLYERLLRQIAESTQEDSLFKNQTLFELQYILGRLKEYPFIEKLINEQNIEADFSDRAAIIISTIEAYTLDNALFKKDVRNLEKELLEYKLKNLYDDVMFNSKNNVFNISQLMSLFNALPDKYCTEDVAIILKKNYHQASSDLLSLKPKDIDIALQKEIEDISTSRVDEPFISLWIELFIDKISLLEEKGLLSTNNHYNLLKALPEEQETATAEKRNHQLLKTARSLFLKETSSSSEFIADLQKLHIACGYSTSQFSKYLLEEAEIEESEDIDEVSNPIVLLHDIMLISLDNPETLDHVSQSGALIHIKAFYPQKLITDGLVALKNDVEKLKSIYDIDTGLNPILSARLITLEQSVTQLVKLYPQNPCSVSSSQSYASKKLFGSGLSSPSQKTKNALEKIKKEIINDSANLEISLKHVFDFIEVTLNDLHASQKTQLTTMLKASLAFEMLEKITHNGSVTRRNDSLELIINHSSMSSLTLEQKQALQDRAEIYENNAKENKARPLLVKEKKQYLEEVGQEITCRLKAVDMIFRMQNGSYNSQETQAQKDFIDIADYFRFSSLRAGMLAQKENHNLTRTPYDRVCDITETLMIFNSRDILIDEQHRQNIQKNKLSYMDGLPLLFSLDTFLTNFLDKRDFQKDLNILRGESPYFTQEGDQQIPYIAMLHYQEYNQRQNFFENIRKSLPDSELACLKPIVMIYDIDENFAVIDKIDHMSELLDNFKFLIDGKGFPRSDMHHFEKIIQELQLPLTSNKITEILNNCSFFYCDKNEDLKGNIVKSLSMQSLKIYKEYLLRYPVDKENCELMNDLIAQYELDDFEKGRAIKLPILAARYAQKNPNSSFAKSWTEHFTRLYVETSHSQELSALSFQLCAKIIARSQALETRNTPLAKRLYHNHPWIQSIAFALPQNFDSGIPDWFSSVAHVIKNSYANMYKILSDSASLVKKITTPSYFSNSSAQEIESKIKSSYENLDMVFDIFSHSNKVAQKIAFSGIKDEILSRDHELTSKQEFLSLNYEMAEILSHIQNSIASSVDAARTEKNALPDEQKIKAALDTMIFNLRNPEYRLKILTAAQPRIIEKTITNAANEQVVITQKFTNNDLLQGLYASLTQLVGMNTQIYNEYQPVLNELLSDIIVSCQSFSEENNLAFDLSYFQEPYLDFWKKSLESCDGSAKAPRFPSQESCLQFQKLYDIIMQCKSNDADKEFFKKQAEHCYDKLVVEILSCLNNLNSKHPLNQKAIIGDLKDTLKGLLLIGQQSNSFTPRHEQIILLQRLNIEELKLDTEAQLLLNLLSKSPQNMAQLCDSYVNMWKAISESYNPSENLYLNHEKVQELLLVDSHIRDSLESSQLTIADHGLHTQAITEANRQYNDAIGKLIQLCCEHNGNLKDFKKSLAALEDLLALANDSSSFVIQECHSLSLTKTLKAVLDKSTLPIDELMAETPDLLAQVNTKFTPEQILSQLTFLVKAFIKAPISQKANYSYQIKESLTELLKCDFISSKNMPEAISFLKEQILRNNLDNETQLLISLNLCVLDSATSLYEAPSHYLSVWNDIVEKYEPSKGQDLNIDSVTIILAAHEKLDDLLKGGLLSQSDEPHLRSVLQESHEHYNKLFQKIIVTCCAISDKCADLQDIQQSFFELDKLLSISKKSEVFSMNLAHFDMLKTTVTDICTKFDISFEKFSKNMPSLAQEFIANNKESHSIKYEESPTGVDQFPDSASITASARHLLHKKSPKLKD